MNGLTTITTKGQVTIPGEVRKALGVKIGDRVSFTEVSPSYKKAVIKIISTDIVEELSGSLQTKTKEMSSEKARKAAGRILLNKYRIK